MTSPFLKLKNYLLLELKRIDVYDIIIDFEKALQLLKYVC